MLEGTVLASQLGSLSASNDEGRDWGRPVDGRTTEEEHWLLKLSEVGGNLFHRSYRRAPVVSKRVMHDFQSDLSEVSEQPVFMKPQLLSVVPLMLSFLKKADHRSDAC